MNESAKAAGRSASAWVCDLCCLVFGSWTLISHAVVALHGNAHTLSAAAAVALPAAALLIFAAARCAGFELGSCASDSADLEPSAAPAVLCIAFCAAAIGIGAWFAVRQDLVFVCAACIGYFALSYVTILRWDRAGTHGGSPVAVVARRGFGRESAWLFALGLVHAALALAAHVSDPDDSLYVNMAVSVADFPNRALLSTDTLHGVASAPFKFAAYRFQSLELGVGLLNHWTGVPALVLFHLLVPALAAFVVPLALARLVRELDPRRTVCVVTVALLLLIFDAGGGAGSYQRFGFIRLFQGKAIFASVGLPLLFAYGLRFGARPSASGFCMLALAQIAALGTTVTAIWAAPAAAMLGIASALRLRISSITTLLLGLGSSFYVLAVGLYLKVHVYADPGGSVEAALSGSGGDDAGAADAAVATTRELFTRAYAMVLGQGTHLLAALLVTLLTWPVCRTARARRFAVVVPLGFFALLGNPWIIARVAQLTTESIYWRVLWLLPVPVLSGLLLTTLIADRPGPSSRLRMGAFLCAAIALVGWQAHYRPALQRAALGLPGLKVDPLAYRVAKAVIEHVGPKRYVLAPLRVSQLLPMLNGYSYPLVTKPRFVPVSLEERAVRMQLTRAIDVPPVHLGPLDPPFDAEWLTQQLNAFHVAGVAFARGQKRPKLVESLGHAGFSWVATVDGHQIWTRPWDAIAVPSLAHLPN